MKWQTVAGGEDERPHRAKLPTRVNFRQYFKPFPSWRFTAQVTVPEISLKRSG